MAISSCPQSGKADGVVPFPLLLQEESQVFQVGMPLHQRQCLCMCCRQHGDIKGIINAHSDCTQTRLQTDYCITI